MSHKNSEVFLIRSDEGETRIARSDEIVSAARKIMSDRVRGRVPMTSPKVVKDFLSIKLGALEYELFCLLLLDLCGVAIYVERASELTISAEEASDNSQHY